MDLHTRMKQYEALRGEVLPHKTHTIIRMDGRAFHTYTARFMKPHDPVVQRGMYSAMELVRHTFSARLAYMFSDEISILITDLDNPDSQPIFGGNLQKLVSVSASTATAGFMRGMLLAKAMDPNEVPLPTFDSRAFTIDDPEEVANYFLWRQFDCKRNGVMSYVRHFYRNQDLNLTLEQAETILEEVENPPIPEAVRLGSYSEKGRLGVWSVDWKKHPDHLRAIVRGDPR